MSDIPALNSRIKQLTEKKFFGNVSNFARSIDVVPQKINRLFNIDGRTGKYPDPNKTDILERIEATFNDVNPIWLRTGEGEMIVMEGKSLDENFPKIDETQIQYAPAGRFPKKNNGSSLIPVYNKDFIAGDAVEIYEDPRDEQVSYFMQIPQFKGCIGFPVYTDSMEKLIKAGSICFGQKLEMWMDHLEYGQVYGIVCHDNRRYLKYIKKYRDNEEEFFNLVSENDHYDSFKISKKSIKNIWLVHGWINLNT